MEKGDGSYIFDQNEILTELRAYYKNLYSEQACKYDSNLQNDLVNCNTSKLDKAQKDSIEGLLQYHEVINTLKNMKNDKSPGNDGLTTEVYEVF